MTNLSEYSRSSWVTFTVPAESVPAGRLEFVPGNFPVIAGDRVGPRGRLVHVRAKLGAYEHVVGKIAPAPSMQSKSKGRDSSDSLPMANAAVVPELQFWLHDGPVRFKPTNWKVVEEGPARIVVKGWGRVPKTQFVVSWYLYHYAGHPSVPYELWVCNSDPRTRNLIQPINAITMSTGADIYPRVDFAWSRGGTDPFLIPNGWGALLMPYTWFGDGQGYAWQGRLLATKFAATREWQQTAFAEVQAPAVGVALNWDGHWGPWGTTPVLHPYEDTPRRQHGIAALNRRYHRFAQMVMRVQKPWVTPPLGLKTVPRWTGDHPDFGVCKHAATLAPKVGGPAHLWESTFSALFEACRPSFFFEADGTRIKLEDHPRLWFHGLRPHWSTAINKDWLGKNPNPKVETQGGIGLKDWEHISSNNLAGLALLTGSHMFRDFCRHETEGWLFGKRVGSGYGAPRGAGRSLLHAAWMYLVTGDERLKKRLAERLRPTYSEFLHSSRNGWQIRVLAHNKDGRNLGGRYEAWSPWQHALALTGVDAVARTMSPEYYEISRPLARTLIFYGWWKKKDGRWTVGHAVRYLEGKDEGKALSAQAYLDPTQVKNSDNTSFDVWSWPAVRIALRYALEDKDAAYVDRCRQILAQLDADNRRVINNPPGFDRASEWKAVR